jgi:hypothetical protein
MPTGDIMVRLLLRQVFRRPLGYLPAAGWQYWLDYHLSDLVDIATTDYYIHRASERPHWVFAETHGAEICVDDCGGSLPESPQDSIPICRIDRCHQYICISGIGAFRIYGIIDRSYEWSNPDGMNGTCSGIQ